MQMAGTPLRPGLPPQAAPMTPEQLGLAQRPGVSMVSNSGLHQNPSAMTMVRQPGIVHQSAVTPGAQMIAANARVSFFQPTHLQL